MITSLFLWDANLLTSVELDTLIYPLQKFTWTTEEDNEETRKVYGPGSYEVFNDPINMLIDCEGEILGTSTSDFNTKRKALRRCMYPNPNIVPVVRRHSRLILLIDGDSSPYYADVTKGPVMFPNESVGSPMVSAFQVQWKCPAGFWTSAATGLLAYDI